MNLNRKRTLLYIAITFGLTWLLLLLIPLTGHTYGDVFSTLLLAGCMFMPTVGNILTRLITGHGLLLSVF